MRREHISMKVWCLKCLSDGLENLTVCPFISFLSLQLNEFPQSEIKQNYLQFKTFITAIADKKIISVFCVSGSIVLPTSVCCSNEIPTFFSLTLFSPGIRNTREKKLINNFI